MQLQPLKETFDWLEAASRGLSTINLVQCEGARSFADDLVTGQGVVLSGAASIRRPVETQPSVGRFVFLKYLMVQFFFFRT